MPDSGGDGGGDIQPQPQSQPQPQQMSYREAAHSKFPTKPQPIFKSRDNPSSEEIARFNSTYSFYLLQPSKTNSVSDIITEGSFQDLDNSTNFSHVNCEFWKVQPGKTHVIFFTVHKDVPTAEAKQITGAIASEIKKPHQSPTNFLGIDNESQFNSNTRTEIEAAGYFKAQPNPTQIKNLLVKIIQQSSPLSKILNCNPKPIIPMVRSQVQFEKCIGVLESSIMHEMNTPETTASDFKWLSYCPTTTGDPIFTADKCHVTITHNQQYKHLKTEYEVPTMAGGTKKIQVKTVFLYTNPPKERQIPDPHIPDPHNGVPAATPAALPLTSQDSRKTVLCRHFQHTNECPYGDRCNFAHGHQDLRPKKVNRHNGNSAPMGTTSSKNQHSQLPSKSTSFPQPAAYSQAPSSDLIPSNSTLPLQPATNAIIPLTNTSITDLVSNVDLISPRSNSTTPPQPAPAAIIPLTDTSITSLVSNVDLISPLALDVVAISPIIVDLSPPLPSESFKPNNPSPTKPVLTQEASTLKVTIDQSQSQPQPPEGSRPKNLLSTSATSTLLLPHETSPLLSSVPLPITPMMMHEASPLKVLTPLRPGESTTPMPEKGSNKQSRQRSPLSSPEDLAPKKHDHSKSPQSIGTKPQACDPAPKKHDHSKSPQSNGTKPRAPGPRDRRH